MHKLSKALTFMGALLALTFCAVSCKTDDDNEPTMYTVTVSDSLEHGKVTADKSSAEAGAKVKLTPTADSGYELDSYSVKDEKSNTIPVTEGTFTMPKSNVTVSATFKETAETVNKNAANAVIAKITAIGTVAYTDESKEKIDEARTAYNALTKAQKALVPEETLNLLTAAETKYAELKAAAMYMVTVTSSIEHGKVSVDKTSAEAGVSVKLTATADSGYELDSYSVKDASANELTVTDGTFTMPKSNVTVSATFKETADTVNQKAAAAVIAKITAIGTVTYTSESKEKIDEARTAYNALTEAQKALVPEETLNLLTAAETKYAELKAAAMYTVTVTSSIEHGKVSVDKTSAEAGATIKLTATADSGYELGSYSVKDASANELTVTNGTFTMPKSNVTVSATFKETAVTPQKTAGSISYASTTVSKTTADEAFTNTLTKTGDGTVTYASSKTDVAEVNTQTGLVTIKGAGETTITATVADSDTYTYATKTASYTLTVTKAAASISYATTSVEKTTADEAFTNELTKTGDGTVTYASSKTDVVTVNATTGEVTIKGAGETTITATVADSDTYTYATKTASYTLTVTKAVASISYATTAVKKTTADTTFTNELTKTGDGTVSYASSKETVATVNASTGEVTIVGAGTATITATVTDSASYTYATKTATYTLTVTQAATLADVFLNGSVTTIKFNTYRGAQSATFENNNGTFSVTSGAAIPPKGDRSDPNYIHGEIGVKSVSASNNRLLITYGFPDSDVFDTIFTFNKEDNSYSITGDGYFEISDITALEVNGTDIKSTLTKK